MNYKKTLLLFIGAIFIFTGCSNPSSSDVTKTYTLSYDDNGSNTGSVPQSGTFREGDSVTVAGNEGNLVKTSYPFFVGWNTAPDGSGEFFRPGDTLKMPGSDKTLFAYWVGAHEVNVSGVSGGDDFAFSVDIDGDYAVFGVPQYKEKGAVYVYHRTGPNSWDSGHRLDGKKSDSEFGYSVSISGDYILVGARFDLDDTKGAAYIYERTGVNNWGNEKVLKASDGAKEDEFGYCVSIDGDSAAIGTGWAEAVYVYKKGDNGWSNPSETIIGSSTELRIQFGKAISLDADTIAIGAYSKNYRGVVYVYKRAGDNSWGNRTELSAPDLNYNKNFGISVALDGDYLVIGDTNLKIMNNSAQGGAYVYQRMSGNSWGNIKNLIASDGRAGDEFGTVAISGDTILVGAQKVTIGENTFQGAVYMFSRTESNNWNAVSKLTDPSGAMDEYFSIPALNDKSLVIGALGTKLNKAFASIYLYK
ncbi:InlB B-repeat-containing protein [Spirochaeta cellobiosiphila]|uniref:InlB B-repeat-containing protein n=1 Tax=Spirochaeta cellobiosiphila TaxID=504483 RepID=UPI0003FACD10|nr:InlB B-repeat-containing protein [Spirochaeta cellobiosiphila]